VATSRTREQVEAEMDDAIDFHFEGFPGWERNFTAWF
jgi:predicted RNase H-like HicB family nuclease